MLLRLKKNLASYTPPNNTHVRKRASVLIPVFQKEGELYLLLTKRSAQLSSHTGQVSFPGGKQDEEDIDDIHTALRETHEEIGLERERVTVIGQIDQIVSRYYHLVTPVVGLIPHDFCPRPNYHEIESVFDVRLSFFMEEQFHTVHEIKDGKFPYLSHHFSYRAYDIWGMTAMLILQLLEVGLEFVPNYLVHHPDSPTWMELSQQFTGNEKWENGLQR